MRNALTTVTSRLGQMEHRQASDVKCLQEALATLRGRAANASAESEAAAQAGRLQNVQVEHIKASITTSVTEHMERVESVMSERFEVASAQMGELRERILAFERTQLAPERRRSPGEFADLSRMLTELSSMKERLENTECVVGDSVNRHLKQVDALRGASERHALALAKMDAQVGQCINSAERVSRLECQVCDVEGRLGADVADLRWKLNSSSETSTTVDQKYQRSSTTEIVREQESRDSSQVTMSECLLLQSSGDQSPEMNATCQKLEELCAASLGGVPDGGRKSCPGAPHKFLLGSAVAAETPTLERSSSSTVLQMVDSIAVGQERHGEVLARCSQDIDAVAASQAAQTRQLAGLESRVTQVEQKCERTPTTSQVGQVIEQRCSSEQATWSERASGLERQVWEAVSSQARDRGGYASLTERINCLEREISERTTGALAGCDERSLEDWA